MNAVRGFIEIVGPIGASRQVPFNSTQAGKNQISRVLISLDRKLSHLGSRSREAEANPHATSRRTVAPLKLIPKCQASLDASTDTFS